MHSNLRQLEAFVNVCLEGSVTRAASKMSLTQSAVSVLVRQFEDAYGATLFERAGRGVRPTPLAREMVPVAQHIFGEIAAFERRLRDGAARERGTIDLAVTPTIAATLIPSVLESFSTRFPDVRLHVHDGAQSDILVLVSSGSAAFGIGTFEERPEFDRIPLLRYPLVLVCRKSMFPASRRRIGWTEIVGLPIVAISHGNSIRTWIDETMQHAGLRFEPTWEVAQFASAIAMVRSNLGCTILPGYLDYDYAAMDMVAIELVKPRTMRELVIVTQRNAVLPPATQALVTMIRETLARP